MARGAAVPDAEGREETLRRLLLYARDLPDDQLRALITVVRGMRDR
ncbi:MAG: hypothetical protein AAFQ71_15740 [Planctomycetota bacterium]